MVERTAVVAPRRRERQESARTAHPACGQRVGWRLGMWGRRAAKAPSILLHRALEDIVADFIALGLVTAEMASAHAAAAKLLQLVRLSQGIASDGSFARQARRKLV